MRIPLDYYRILGLPIQATDEQLKKAYEDRSQQLPRREYSEKAIAARKQLLTQAYLVLSDPQQRAEYDKQFLEATYNIVPQPQPAKSKELNSKTAKRESPDLEKISEYGFSSASTSSVAANSSAKDNLERISSNSIIEITPELLIGALLIFLELGEYELVLRLGIAHLNSYSIIAQEQADSQQSPIAIAKEDIILCLALAYLELGREQWGQQEYENAEVSWQMGHNLLTDNKLFPSVKELIEADLYKLRPYRIVDLLVHSNKDQSQRSRGLQLLREMLQERQGIEGKGEDRSGLSFEQFLRYIQQLRTHLTAAEQQELFMAEAKRPSAVAIYLAAYTLLARGYAEKQPQLIVQAQKMLEPLSQHQDLHWEQAVCALLLGQTQKANSTLEQSREEEILDLIRQYSQDAPDLLPGLCFYGEQWLHKEVLSQFLDLAECKLTLKEYFADRQVQTYLEQLSLPQQPQTVPKITNSASIAQKKSIPKEKSKRYNFLGWVKRKSSTPSASSSKNYAPQPRELAGARIKAGANASSFKAKAVKNGNSGVVNSQLVQKKPTKPANKPPVVRQQYRPSPSFEVRKQAPYPPSSRRRQVKRKKSNSLLLTSLLLLSGLVIGVGTLGFALTRQLLNRPAKQAKSEELTIKLNESLFATPASISSSNPTEPVTQPTPKPKPKQNESLNTAIAQQTIQRWLDSKSQAFGSEHKINQLNTILAAPILSQWRDRAQKYQQSNAHRKYQHTVKVSSVKYEPQNPNQAVVEAQVQEAAQHYQSGKLDQAQSYNDNLLVRYDLVRQGEQWLIKNISVLKTL